MADISYNHRQSLGTHNMCSEYGTLQLVTISQSGAAPELFNVHASKTKSYAQGLVLETATPQTTMQMPYVHISLPSYRS